MKDLGIEYDFPGYVSNTSNTRNSVSLEYPNTEKRVESMMCIDLFG